VEHALPSAPASKSSSPSTHDAAVQLTAAVLGEAVKEPWLVGLPADTITPSPSMTHTSRSVRRTPPVPGLGPTTRT
jgi:hypothetical protein